MARKQQYRRRFWIGVDIGKQGSIVIQHNDFDPYGPNHFPPPIETYKMPMIGTELDYLALHQLLEPYEGGNGMVVFEKLGVIFGSSKQTAFSMGHQAGAVEMACVALSIPFTKVRAVDWQKEMFTGVDQITKPSKAKSGSSRDTKAMALIATKRLFPKQVLTFGDKAKKPHDGLVDALLMSEYAKRKYP